MNEQQRAVLDELFRTYTMAYMQRFTSMFRGETAEQTDAAIEEWKELFAEQMVRSRLTLRQVRSALAVVATRFPEYPPTWGEFIGLCRAYSEPVVALASPRTHGSDASRAAMDEMMSMLARKMTSAPSRTEASHGTSD